jgi:hypothetical protein
MLFFCYDSSFKLFLELEPQLRDILHQFYDSKYASCLKLLLLIKVASSSAQSSWIFDACHVILQDNLLLDLYLAPHVNTLYTKIRNRALCQVSCSANVEIRTRSKWGPCHYDMITRLLMPWGALWIVLALFIQNLFLACTLLWLLW